MAAETAWLVAYDITDPGRLGRVHRRLTKCALAIQYSLFLAVMSSAQIDRIRDDLRRLIRASEDDVRLYALRGPCEARLLGRRVLPSGVDLGGIGLGFFQRIAGQPVQVIGEIVKGAQAAARGAAEDRRTQHSGQGGLEHS